MSFHDKQFPANDSSIGELDGHYSWARSKQIFGSRFRVFSDISPQDIVQGALGDCWFLSALSVLAEHPERVKKLFKDSRVQRNGRYVLRMFLDGKETFCVVDDSFPVVQNTRSPAFSKNRDANEIWVMLAEKAYAKLHGSYQAIEAGAPGDALADLTGAPYKSYDLQDVENRDKLWTKLVDFDKQHFVMCASVPNVDGEDLEKTLGLVEAHAYGLLGVYEINGLKLCKIRNPHGKTEWKGDFSDQSDKWTRQLKKAVGFKKSEDGVFFMTFEDFASTFYNVTVLKFHPNWNHCASSQTFNDVKGCFSLSLEKDTKMHLTLHQKRGAGRLHTRFAVLDAATHEPMGGSREIFAATEALSSKELSLTKGNYIVVVEIYPNDASVLPMELTLSAYSANKVKLQVDEAIDSSSVSFILPDHVKKFGRCSVCKKVLSGTCVTAMGRKFHPKCFTCDRCNTQLEGSFLVMGNKPICDKCHETAVRRATPGSSPQAKRENITTVGSGSGKPTNALAIVVGVFAVIFFLLWNAAS